VHSLYVRNNIFVCTHLLRSTFRSYELSRQSTATFSSNTVDVDNEAFRAAVTSSTASIFQKSHNNPQQIIAQRTTEGQDNLTTATATATTSSWSSLEPVTAAAAPADVALGISRYSPMRSSSLRPPDNADDEGGKNSSDLRKRSCPGPLVESIPEHSAPQDSKVKVTS
jgi:hypothetical protein